MLSFQGVFCRTTPGALFPCMMKDMKGCPFNVLWVYEERSKSALWSFNICFPGSAPLEKDWSFQRSHGYKQEIHNSFQESSKAISLLQRFPSPWHDFSLQTSPFLNKQKWQTLSLVFPCWEGQTWVGFCWDPNYKPKLKVFGSPRDFDAFFQAKVPTEFLGAYKLDLVKALEGFVVAVD